MPIVVDASITLAMLFEDERTAAVEATWQRVAAEGGIAPAHFPIEVANGILMAVRRGRFDTRDAAGMFGVIVSLAIGTDAGAASDAFEHAERHRLTVYDAAYLELAMRRGMPLATLDKALLAAARAVGIVVLGA